MKKLLLIATIGSILASCSKSNDTFKPDPNKNIPIQGLSTLKATTTPTLEEVVRETTIMKVANLEYGIADHQRDIANNRLMVQSVMVIDQDAKLYAGFIEGRDIVFVRFNFPGDLIKGYRDTVAYIPNAVMVRAEAAIKKAYNENNLEKCFTIMDTCFKFIPITGKQWEELKRQGKQ